MTEFDSCDLLDGAAACLLTVAYADPFTTPPAVRLPCLWAVELLRSVGAAPTGSRSGSDARGHIREALTMLSLLPLEIFADHAVLEATAVAREALEAAG
jgi:hypothetical protein